MDEHSFLRQLGQVSSGEVGEVFRDFVRGQVRILVSEVMAAEVSELCGPKHLPAFKVDLRSTLTRCEFRPILKLAE